MIIFSNPAAQFTNFQLLFSEPYIEAVPTVLILLVLVLKNNDTFLGTELNFLGIEKQTMFFITFSISVFAGSFGIAKFLKLGPCQIVPSQDLHCGFFFVFITMGTTLIAKGCVLSFSLSPSLALQTYGFSTTCLIWFCSCVLPQFILVSKKNKAMFSNINTKYFFLISSPAQHDSLNILI